MNKNIIKQLRQIVDMGAKAKDTNEREHWLLRVEKFMLEALGEEAATNFLLTHKGLSVSRDKIAACLGHIEGLIAKYEAGTTEATLTKANDESNLAASTRSKLHVYSQRKVFIVHGHDNETKESVARFVQKLGLEPIILHEKASSGRTIIEKFEVFSDVFYAVVLLCPDDMGSMANKTKELKPRARQNVILELGYFMGKLGRNRICALYKGGVEIPSDYHGVVYIELDSKGAWKTKLAQELVQAGLNIKLDGLLG